MKYAGFFVFSIKKTKAHYYEVDNNKLEKQ